MTIVSIQSKPVNALNFNKGKAKAHLAIRFKALFVRQFVNSNDNHAKSVLVTN